MRSLPMPKAVKDKAQTRSMNTKGKGAYKTSDLWGTYGEQSSNPEKLPFTQLVQKY